MNLAQLFLSLVVERSARKPTALHNADLAVLEVILCSHHFYLLADSHIYRFDQALEHCLGAQHSVLSRHLLHSLQFPAGKVAGKVPEEDQAACTATAKV